jgi:hypothetical protein
MAEEKKKKPEDVLRPEQKVNPPSLKLRRILSVAINVRCLQLTAHALQILSLGSAAGKKIEERILIDPVIRFVKN